MRDHLGEFYDKTSDFQQGQFDTLCGLINKSVANPTTIKTLMDIGAGTGVRTTQCFKLFPALEQITAFEPDHDMIAVAQEKYNDPRIQYIMQPAAAIEKLDVRARLYDFILSNWSVHWVPDKEKMMTDLSRLTKPGSYLAFSTCERLPAMLAMIDTYIRAEFLIPAERTPYYYMNRTEWTDFMARHGWDIIDMRHYPVAREIDSAEHYLKSWFAASATKFMHGKHLVEMNHLSLNDLHWMMNRAFPSQRHENGISFSEDVMFFTARRR